MRIEDVRKARKEEIGYMQGRNIWKLVPVEECWRRTGKPPIGTRWVDTNKGTEQCPEVRCRLVARDFKGKKRNDEDREDLYAATPPSEAERKALSRAVTRSRKGGGRVRKRKIMFIDARKAHLNPKCQDDMYIELPAKARGGAGVCGKLVHWLYGCCLAA